MEQTLDQSGPWLVGKKLTLADINLMPFIARLDYLSLLDLWTSQHRRFGDWWEQSKNLSSYREAISDALPQKEIQSMRLHGSRIKEGIRNLRDRYYSIVHSNDGMPATS
jgi:glutathione S-transferase